MIEEWNESRLGTKEEIQKWEEKQAFKNLMLAINDMGGITKEDLCFKVYSRKWDILMDRARIYKRVAELDKKYGLDKEV